MTEALSEVPKPTLIARIATVVLVLFTGLMWWHILRVLALWPQPFEPIFDRFDLRGGLPLMTDLLMRSSHAITDYWYLFAAGVVAVMAGLVWLGMRRDRVGRLALVALGSFLAAGATWVLVLAGLMSPLIHLIQQVSSKR